MAADVYEEPRVVQDPLDAPLMGSNTIQPRVVKDGVTAPGQILDVNFLG